MHIRGGLKTESLKSLNIKSSNENLSLQLHSSEDELQTGFAGALDDVPVLPASRLVAGEAEGHDGEHQDDEDADDGKDVRPAQLACAEVIVVDVVAADATHVHVIPPGREDHAAQEHQNACTQYTDYSQLNKFIIPSQVN